MAKYKGKDVDLTPTSAMAAEAVRALAWRKEGNKGGTAIGVARAVQLKNKTELSPSTVKRMHSFFSRHEVDKQAEGFSPGEKGYPSPGRVAWAMWGGDSGQTWAAGKTKTFANIDEASKKKADFAKGDYVSWGSSGGRARGRIDRVVTNGKINVPNSTVTVTGTTDDPAALITVWQNTDDGWKASDVKVGHKLSTLTKITALKSDDGIVSQRQVTIKRIDEDKRVVYGEVYAPYVLDTYGEFMTPDDIELMAHRFLRLDLGTVIDTQHDNVPNGSFPVESFVAREGDPNYTPGAWVLGVKIPDDAVWTAVKSGILNGFSFQSLVRPRDVDVVYEVVRDHLGETEPVDDGHQHLYFLQVDEMGKVIGGRTNEVDGHSHEIRRASVTDLAAAHSHRFFL